MKPVTQSILLKEAKNLLLLLKKHGIQLVLAESCTGGMVSATLTKLPGISKYFCGSSVVYQTATKSTWLKIPQSLFQKHDPASPAIAEKMALQILKKTPHATLSAAITGYLGPESPPKSNGLIFISVAMRKKNHSKIQPSVFTQKHHLPPGSRTQRQLIASHSVLLMVRSLLKICA